MSWAAIARATPAPAEQPEPSVSTADQRIAVVDANAIISGLRLEHLADRYCTIPEVLAEIRDKQSRQFLSMLPYHLDVKEPDEESLKAVQRFARETGDIHSLSTVDIKLLALAHTLEVAAYGAEHLREHPVQVRLRPRHKTGPRALPGWGNVNNPEEWKAVDEVPDNVLASGQGQSRIIGGAQPLEGPDQQQQQQQGGAEAEATAAAPGPSAPEAQQQEQQGAVGAAGTSAQGAGGCCDEGAKGQAEGGHDHDDDDDDDGEDGAAGGDGDWETVASSRNAARRQQRKQRRRQAWLEANGLAPASAAPPAGHQTVTVAAPAPAAVAASTGAAAPQAQQQQGGERAQASTAAAGEEGTAGQQQQAQGSEGEGEESHDDDDDEDEEEGEVVYELETEEGEEGEEGAGCGAGSELGEASTATAAEGEAEAPLLPNTSSRVVCVTADFAMQNVLLQMGLRLVSRDGKQINRLSRWALRCSACFFVTKEAGRVFCPRCGNLTLDKVEVAVGPDGAEYYGVRKKFILKGTKYSLPKPKGGRAAGRNPILREDVMLAKAARWSKGRRQGGKGGADKDGGADAFAPEFGADTWHTQQQASRGVHSSGVKVAFTDWKNNPNAVKPSRSNRRR